MKIIEILGDPKVKYKKVIEKIICKELSISKEEFFKNYDTNIDENKYNKIMNMYYEYQEGKKPLEYILWYVEFMWLKFKVNTDTLIPRPETEYMIQAINEYIQKEKKDVNIIDVWTWSWVLWISSSYHNKKYVNEVLLMDISEKALDIAKQNYNKIINTTKNLNIKKSNLLEYFIQNLKKYDNKENIIIGNLPYIPDTTFDSDVEDNVKLREPRIAFVWWDDWLDLYRQMFAQIINIGIDKINFTMFLEMMTDQIDILRKEYWDIFRFEEIKTFHFNIKILKVTKV